MYADDVLEPLKTDLYLQILHQARNIGDQQLVELVRHKLNHTQRERVVATPTGCVIIQFPTTNEPPPDPTPPVYRSKWPGIVLGLAVFPGSILLLMALCVWCSNKPPFF